LRGHMGSGQVLCRQPLALQIPGSVRLDRYKCKSEVQNLSEVIVKEYVITELYHGNFLYSRSQWIKAFKIRD
jgi:hypothetical protein